MGVTWVSLTLTTLLILGVHRTLSLSQVSKRAPRRRWGRLRRWNYAILWGSTLALGATSLPGVFSETALSGWLLFVHALVAGAFLISFGIFGLWEVFGSRPGEGVLALVRWVSLTAGTGVLLSMLLGMGKWATTAELLELIEIHGMLSALFFNVLGMHAYFVWDQSRGGSQRATANLS